MNEIIPDVWITSYSVYKKKPMLNCYHINTKEDLEILGNNSEYKEDIKKSLIKYQIIKLYKYISEKITIIHNELMKQKVIIITCKNGNVISPLVCVCYIIKYGGLDVETAIKCVTSKRSDIIIDDLFFKNIANKIYNDSL
tara:strand:- start:364 stop:783 length:420 start_codon:yes stop_codon:yes gene_type:complete